jgi:hypothetical protein
VGGSSIARAALAACCALFAVAGGTAQADSKIVYDSIGTQGTLGGQFERPIGVAANTTGIGASKGDIYVVDSLNNRIQRFDKSGEFISAWGADVLTPSVNEVQQVTLAATAGTYTLAFEGQATAAIAFNATAAIVATRLRALSAIGSTGVLVSGNAGAPYNIAFQGALSATDAPQLVANTTLLTGTATPSTLTQGAGQYEICTVAANCRPGAASGGANATDNAKNGSLSQPQYVAVDQDTGNVYVSDRENRRVSVYDGAGVFLRSFGYDVVARGPGNVSETQSLTIPATSGTYTLTFNGQTTASLAFNASPSAIEAALNGLSTIGGAGGSVSVSGPVSNVYSVVFGGAFAGQDVGQITLNPSGLGIPVGTSLTCAGGPLSANLSYQWLANGVPATGAGNASASYTVDATDAGKALQCQVKATTATGSAPTGPTAALQTSNPRLIVSNVPSPAPPLAPTANITVTGNATTATPPGNTLSCTAGTWTGATNPFAFQWYRNGVPLVGNGANTSVYTLQAADLTTAAAFQCAVTGSNAGGAVTKFSANKNTASPALGPIPTPPTPTSTVADPDVAATVTQGASYEICTASEACKFGSSGTEIGQLSASTNPPLGAIGNFGIAVTPPDGISGTGKVYLADTGNFGGRGRVMVYNLDGTSPSVFGQTATDFSLEQPRHVAVDSRGIVYANSVESGSGIVRRYDSLNANGGGVGFLAPIKSPPLTLGEAATVTAGLAVDPDGDGAGADADVLDVLRIPSTSAQETPTVVQQLGPANQPGLAVAPASVDAEHGAEADLRRVNGLGLDQSSGGRIYISESLSGQRVWILSDPPPVPPIATTGDSSDGFDPTLRTLHGIVNPNEFKVTGCRFEYGPTTGYGASAPCAQSPDSLGKGTVDALVSASTEPLEPETTYHYRLVAANAGKTAFGEDRTFTSGPPSPDPCSNAAIRAAQGIRTVLLPDCMALEMVSPGAKGSVTVGDPEVSVNGERVLFSAAAPISGEASVLDPLGGVRYVASRDAVAENWETLPTAPLSPKLTETWTQKAAGFSPDFSSWFSVLATEPQHNVAVEQAFKGELGGPLTPFSPLLTPLNAAALQSDGYYLAVLPGTRLEGASADQSHLFLAPGFLEVSEGNRTNVAYLAGDPVPAGPEAVPNTYLMGLAAGGGEPTLELLARDGEGKLWGGNCGTHIGGSELLGKDLRTSLSETTHSQGAIAADGSRVYLSTRPSQSTAGNCEPVANKIRILKRVESAEGPVIGPLFGSECARVAPTPCKLEAELNSSDNYQAASADGSKVYFTSSRQLTDSDLDGALNATGTGTTTKNSIEVTGVVTATGAFTAGMTVSGSGIPVGTKVAGGFGNTIFLSAAATATATGVALNANSECSNSLAVAGCDLYLYDRSRPLGNRLTQVSAGETVGGHSAGQDAKVLDLITAVSGDGSHAYFVAEGVLTGSNEEGRTPSSAVGARNLYAYERDPGHPGGHLAFVGVLDPKNDGNSQSHSGLLGGSPGFNNSAYPVPALGEDGGGNEIGGDGHELVFISHAPLTDDDADGGFADVFSYDAGTGELQRISAAPGGGSDNGAFSVQLRARGSLQDAVPAGPAWAEVGRWASENGDEVVFTTPEGLVPGDTNDAPDNYLWRDGHLVRLPGAVASQAQEVVLSPEGDTIAFATTSRLLPEDRDLTKSVYVARVGGGFATPEPPAICVPDGGDGCREPSPDPPGATGPGSGAAAAGNVREAVGCNGNQVRRGDRCVPKRRLAGRICRKLKGPPKRRCIRKQIRRLNRTASTDRRAAK